MSRPAEPNSRRRAAVHIVSLWALAIAGPIYDVLRRSAEFFVAYRADRSDVLLFVAVVSFLAPLAVWTVVWLAGRLSKTLADGVLTVLVGLFVAIGAAQGLQSLSPPTALHVGMSAGFGILGAALYGYPAVRSFATWLAPAILVFPLVFLLDRAIWPMVWPAHARAALAAGPPTATPIIFVVFDQFPLTSILAPDGSIDGRTYPGFGELARTSTWFSNATTVGELTAWALPPILSGQYAERGQLPTAADYPYNLFTALGPSYKMAVFEPLTGLCPDSICPPSAAVRDAPRLLPMLTDASVVLAHRVVPRDMAGGLPPVDENWRGFAEAQGFQQQWGRERESDRRRIVNNFLERHQREQSGRDALFSPRPSAARALRVPALGPEVRLESAHRPASRFGRWTNDRNGPSRRRTRVTFSRSGSSIGACSG